MKRSGKTLVVVESPAKAKTIKKYLGPSYEVVASKGHIKDLPKKMGIDIEHGFKETYEVIPGKEKVLGDLKTAAKEASEILLATDPDREGEAIAWHLNEELRGKKRAAKGVKNRVEFHEITKKGVQHGVAHPRELNAHLYDAQRARRVLDRIVGYDVSALVWSKLAFGLSAGRVQSVALRLIVDREREIEAFKPEEYWNCGVGLGKTNGHSGASAPAPAPFFARLFGKDGEKFQVKDGDTASAVRAELTGARYQVVRVAKSERKRHAPAPYSTSKLQQDAVNRLGFGAKRTMQIAQGLYEGVDLGKEAGGQVGLITYMRTDSVRSSPEAVAAVREYIETRYGEGFVPAEPNRFKSKKGAQDAHEAIRPTSMELSPENVRRYLKDDQFKLYKLIWNRFIASQMKDAVYDQTTAEIDARAGAALYNLRASGRILKFAGWLEAYEIDHSVPSVRPPALAGLETEEEEAGAGANARAGGGEGATTGTNAGAVELPSETDEATLPELAEGEPLVVRDPPGVVTEQKFTQPPPRYTEGSLVRELEDRGIGRPSTYAEIISKVQARAYVEKTEGGRQFRPTTLGKFVVDGLVSSKLDFMDPAFTSAMEEELDEVESGKTDRKQLLSRFYARFSKQLKLSKKGKRWNPEPIPTDQICDACGTGKMSKRWSKNGWFLGCSNYPKCKNTRDLGPDGNGPLEGTPPRDAGVTCDKCGRPMIIKTGRYGEFVSCTGYPACKNARPVPLGVPCPKCGGDIFEIRARKRGGRPFYGCSNYTNEAIKCDFKLWQKPIKESCPSCGAPFLVHGGTKTRPMIACANKECAYKRAPEGEAPAGSPVPQVLPGGVSASSPPPG